MKLDTLAMKLMCYFVYDLPGLELMNHSRLWKEPDEGSVCEDVRKLGKNVALHWAEAFFPFFHSVESNMKLVLWCIIMDKAWKKQLFQG
jgi:hypothetical protein